MILQQVFKDQPQPASFKGSGLPPRARKVVCFLGVAALCLALQGQASLSAQQRPASSPPRAKEDPPLQTLPPDLGFGLYKHQRSGEIPDLERGRAKVDRRQDFDVLASQGVVLPNGYVPESEWGLVLKDHMFFGLQASGWFKRAMLTATYVATLEEVFDQPQAWDRFASLSASYNWWRSYDARITSGLGFLWRDGLLGGEDSSERGVTLQSAADFYLSDTMLISVGAWGYLPTHRRYMALDTSRCRWRSEYLSRECWDIYPTTQSWPKAGRTMLGYVQWQWFAPEGMIIKLELVSGVGVGTLLDLEGAIYGREGLAVQTARFREDEAHWGPIKGFPLTLHLALGQRWGDIGGQVGLLVLPADQWREGRYADSLEPARREWPVLLPMFSLGYQLF